MSTRRVHGRPTRGSTLADNATEGMLAVGPDLSTPGAGRATQHQVEVMSAIPPYLSRTDVPQFYPVCQRVVDTWIASSTVPIIRIGKKPILRRDDIEAFLDSQVASKPKSKRGRPTKAEQVSRRVAGANGG